VLRAETLADPRVRAALDALVWAVHDQCPALYCGRDAVSAADYSTRRQGQVREGAGGGNIRLFVCASDGRVKAYVAGYWRPARFLELLRELARDALPLEGEPLVAYHVARAAHWAAARDVLVPRSRTTELFAQAARGGESGLGAREVLDQAAALGRLARSYEEAPRWVGRPIDDVLAQVEDEVYTRGAVG